MRDASGLVVEVTLADGTSFYLANAVAEGDDLIALSPYPPAEGRLEAMVKVEGQVLDQTPTVVIVRPEYVTKIELMLEAPAERDPQQVGFRLADEPDESATP
jgi:hypothetical protein